MSNIYLGNLTIKELEYRTGFIFSEEDKKWLEKYRSDEANITYSSEKFHIFDIPFCMVCSEIISDKLKNLLQKYEEYYTSKEPFTIYKIEESEEEINKKLKEKQEKERKENLNSIWNIKWHMLVPVKLNEYNYNCYYKCFINTYTTGYTNIPIIIDGIGYIELDTQGLHGKFNLKNPEIYDDANKYPDWNYIIGLGFCKLNGDYIGNVTDITFNKIEFNLQEAIEKYQELFNEYKEIHFYK